MIMIVEQIEKNNYTTVDEMHNHIIKRSHQYPNAHTSL